MEQIRELDSSRVLSQLPQAQFVMTSQFDGRRSGVLVRWVCACADEPLLISVSLRKGHWISPIIRDSRAFAVCRVQPSDRLVQKKFAESNRAKDGDPFDCMPVNRLVTGAPILTKCSLALDCEVVRHLDLEADFELFIGKVLASAESDCTKVG
jgi:flavin reductase (DIM6/NTAB) family NADH-FMN oxidoreductase RutF